MKNKTRVPKGFVAVKSLKGTVVAIKAAPGTRWAVKGNKIHRKKMTEKTWDQTYRRLRNENIKENPTPPGLSRREYVKLHRLPRPFRIPGTTAYNVMARMWWDRLKRRYQIEFRRRYPEPEFRKLFPLNSKRK